MVEQAGLEPVTFWRRLDALPTELLFHRSPAGISPEHRVNGVLLLTDCSLLGLTTPAPPLDRVVVLLGIEPRTNRL